MVDEHLNSYNTPFKFNGKELDDEIEERRFADSMKISIWKQTGNYYYGARYYNPKWSVWLSVDPLAEKYPGISSFAYVAQNPLKYIDPNGKEIINADRLRLAKYKKYNGLTRKQIKSQFGKAAIADWEKVKNHVKAYEKTISTYRSRATKTDKVMKNWKKASKNLYEKVDNMNVDFYLGVDSVNDGSFGVTRTNIEYENGKEIFVSKSLDDKMLLMFKLIVV